MKRLFITGVPVIGKELIGREEELKEIKHLLLKCGRNFHKLLLN